MASITTTKINAEEAMNILEDLWKKVPRWRFALSGLLPEDTPSPLSVWEKEYVQKIRKEVVVPEGRKDLRNKRDDIEFNWSAQLQKNWKTMMLVLQNGSNKKISKIFRLLSSIGANYFEYQALKDPEVIKGMDRLNMIFAKGDDVSLDSPKRIHVQDNRLAQDFLRWVTGQTVDRPEMLATHLFKAAVPASIRNMVPDVAFDKAIIKKKTMTVVPSRSVLGLLPDLMQITSKAQVDAIVKLKRQALMAKKRMNALEGELNELLAAFNAMPPDSREAEDLRKELRRVQTDYRMAESAFRGADQKLRDPENPVLRVKGRMPLDYQPGSSYYGDKVKAASLSPSDPAYPAIGAPSPVVKGTIDRITKFTRANKRPAGLDKLSGKASKIASETAVDGRRTLAILQKLLAPLGLKFSIALDVKGKKTSLPGFFKDLKLNTSQKMDFEMASLNSFTGAGGANDYAYPLADANGRKPKLGGGLSDVPNTLAAQKAKLFAKQFGGGRPMSVDALVARIERTQRALDSLKTVAMSQEQREEASRAARLQIDTDVDLFVERIQSDINEKRRTSKGVKGMTEDRWARYKSMIHSLYTVAKVLDGLHDLIGVPRDTIEKWAMLSAQYKQEVMAALADMEAKVPAIVSHRVKVARKIYDEQGRGRGNFERKVASVQAKTAAEIIKLMRDINMPDLEGQLSRLALEPLETEDV